MSALEKVLALAAKVTKGMAGYQRNVSGSRNCGSCVMSRFRPGQPEGLCTKVEGPIRRQDRCRYWAAKAS